MTGVAEDELAVVGGSSMMLWKWQLKQLCSTVSTDTNSNRQSKQSMNKQ